MISRRAGTRRGPEQLMTLPRESETVEWKESLSVWKEIVETAAAFATHKGGTIYIGVDRKGEVRGIQHGEKSLEDITNRIVQNTEPRTAPSVRIVTHQKRDILVIEIGEVRAKPVHAFGRPFKRSGRTNQRLSPDQSAAVYMSSRGQTWDETVLDDARLSDISMKRVHAFIATARRERKVAWKGRDAAGKVLRQLELVKHAHPTVAALLLFGAEPQRHLRQSEVRCARFKHDESERPIDFKVIDGTLFDQTEEIMRFIQRNIAMSYEIRDGGPRRTDIWQYPLDAVREAVVNAICHRDYTSTGNVQVRIFDDSLEVWNPGLLPPGLSIRDLKRRHDSRPRNKLIASALFLAGVIEQFGQGTIKILRLCREAGIPAPEFEERGSSFVVRFRKTASIKSQRVGPERPESQPESATQETTQSATQSTDPVIRLLNCLAQRAMSAGELRSTLKLRHRPTFRANYLHPALAEGLIEYTLPDKPNSRLQRYRTTAAGRQLLVKQGKKP